jgi:hypothetical protein
MIQADKAAQQLRPETVAAFAELHMTQEGGEPITPAAHHWLWLRLICNQDIRNLLIIAPPESAKTTWVIAYIACSIGFWPESPRIFAAATGDVAETRATSVKNIVDSDEFKVTFPCVLPAMGMKQKSVSWSVAPDGVPHKGRMHPTISAYGTGGSITGSRAREAIGDDLHDFDNSRTAHQRNYVYSWLHNSFLSRRMSRIGRAILIGTMWHPDDAYARTVDKQNWVVCHIPILSETSDVFATISYPPSYRGERLGMAVGG